MGSTWSSWFVAPVVALAVAACTGDESRPSAFESKPGARQTNEPDLRGLQSAHVRTMQLESDASHEFRLVNDGFEAFNAVHGFVATFYEDRIVLTNPLGANRSWSGSVSVDAWGCPGALTALEHGNARADRNRLDQDHGSVTAWYLNGPLGLEQGFDVAAAPACLSDSGWLTIRMQVDGDLSVRRASADSVEFVDADGIVALHYHGLYVVDAAGDALDARLRVEDGNLSIDVAAADAAFPLAIDPLWSQQAKLVPWDVSPYQFGSSVAVSGDTAIVGATGTGGGSSKGAAYVYVRSGTSWQPQQKLLANDASDVHWFGRSVDLQGDTAVVGANGANAAYVFVRNGTAWLQQQKLVASVGGSSSLGRSVSLDGDTVVVGASNMVRVFVRSGTTWTEQATLVGADTVSGDNYGVVVALSGDTAVVGAPHDDDAGMYSGSAYVFVRSGTTWSQQQKLSGGDTATDDRFGFSVAIDDDSLVVGAIHNDGLANQSGTAYVFVRSGTSWTQQQKLIASDGAFQDDFGHSAAIQGDVAVVGARSADAPVLLGGGAVYVYQRSGAVWSQIEKLIAANPTSQSESFGWRVDLDAGTIIGGAIGGTAPGRAYVFASIQLGAPCSTDAQCPSGFCRDGVCCDGTCGGGVATDCQSCLAAQTGGALDGNCDVVVASQQHVCRGGSGDACDPAELCNGLSPSCPADVVATAATVCRIGSGDACDPNELCSGVAGQACPTDVIAPAGALCRVGSGDVCDPDEACTGAAGTACPPDVVALASEVCRVGSGDQCDPDEYCTAMAGQPCPANAVTPAGITCRPGSGDMCDAPESCSGVASDACPTDIIAPSTTMCRAGSGDVCDPDEYCHGSPGVGCPSDLVAPDGTRCSRGACVNGSCSPSGSGGSNGSGGQGGEAAGGNDSGGAAMDGGGGESGRFVVNETGCGCRTAPRPGKRTDPWLLVVLAALGLRRRTGCGSGRAQRVFSERFLHVFFSRASV